MYTIILRHAGAVMALTREVYEFRSQTSAGVQELRNNTRASTGPYGHHHHHHHHHHIYLFKNYPKGGRFSS